MGQVGQSLQPGGEGGDHPGPAQVQICNLVDGGRPGGEPRDDAHRVEVGVAARVEAGQVGQSGQGGRQSAGQPVAAHIQSAQPGKRPQRGRDGTSQQVAAHIQSAQPGKRPQRGRDGPGQQVAAHIQGAQPGKRPQRNGDGPGEPVAAQVQQGQSGRAAQRGGDAAPQQVVRQVQLDEAEGAEAGRDEAGEPVAAQVQRRQAGQGGNPGREGTRQSVAAHPQLLQAGHPRPEVRYHPRQPVAGQVQIDKSGEGGPSSRQRTGQLVRRQIQMSKPRQSRPPRRQPARKTIPRQIQMSKPRQSRPPRRQPARKTIPRQIQMGEPGHTAQSGGRAAGEPVAGQIQMGQPGHTAQSGGRRAGQTGGGEVEHLDSGRDPGRPGRKRVAAQPQLGQSGHSRCVQRPQRQLVARQVQHFEAGRQRRGRNGSGQAVAAQVQAGQLGQAAYPGGDGSGDPVRGGVGAGKHRMNPRRQMVEPRPVPLVVHTGRQRVAGAGAAHVQRMDRNQPRQALVVQVEARYPQHPACLFERHARPDPDVPALEHTVYLPGGEHIRKPLSEPRLPPGPQHVRLVHIRRGRVVRRQAPVGGVVREVVADVHQSPAVGYQPGVGPIRHEHPVGAVGRIQGGDAAVVVADRDRELGGVGGEPGRDRRRPQDDRLVRLGGGVLGHGDGHVRRCGRLAGGDGQAHIPRQGRVIAVGGGGGAVRQVQPDGRRRGFGPLPGGEGGGNRHRLIGAALGHPGLVDGEEDRLGGAVVGDGHHRLGHRRRPRRKQSRARWTQNQQRLIRVAHGIGRRAQPENPIAGGRARRDGYREVLDGFEIARPGRAGRNRHRHRNGGGGQRGLAGAAEPRQRGRYGYVGLAGALGHGGRVDAQDDAAVAVQDGQAGAEHQPPGGCSGHAQGLRPLESGVVGRGDGHLGRTRPAAGGDGGGEVVDGGEIGRLGRARRNRHRDRGGLGGQVGLPLASVADPLGGYGHLPARALRNARRGDPQIDPRRQAPASPDV